MHMKWLNLVTLLLAIVGGLNWGLVAIGGHDLDFIATMLGGDRTLMAKVAYALVGLSALWQLMPFVNAFRIPEAEAEAGHHPHAPAS
jgi:uncharacterized membrane protein YuzA (DUF378 family)